MSFKRTIENFICEHCGRSVAGNGYTNHCPACLWSKHVDVNPGDRASGCGGMMEPVWIEQGRGKRFILHRCLRCRHEKKNRSGEGDSFEALLAVTERSAG